MTTRPLLSRLRRSQRGAVLVEFAISLPLLLLLFGAIIEGGRMMWSYQTAIAGVRDAARYLGRVVPTNVCPGALPSPGTYNAKLTTIVRDSIGGTSVLPAAVQLDPADPEPVKASFACVNGSYRLASTPVATVTAKIRIDFPFVGFIRFSGGTMGTYLVTTITDQSRVFGS